MTTWQLEPLERIRLFSPIGLQLVDDMTDGDPVGAVRATLDRQETANTWTTTKIKGVHTPAGIVAYPGLGRTSNPVGKPAVTYRVRLDADFYVPVYRATADGIQFQAYPYNDANDPQQFATTATETRLTPAPAYPFASHIPVLRGTVKDGSGARVPDVLVFWGTAPNQERCITAADGGFALPLRLATGAITVSAIDQRTGRHKDQQIALPGDLAKSWTLVIS
jgi:hypothetical protein